MSGRLGLRKKKKERGKTGENHDSVYTPLSRDKFTVTAKGIFLALLSFLLSCLARTYTDLLIIQKPKMSSTLMSLVPVLNGSMNWQAWRPMMMNYLLSQGQWKVILNKFPAPDYETTTTITKTDAEGTHSETVADTSKPPKN